MKLTPMEKRLSWVIVLLVLLAVAINDCTAATPQQAASESAKEMRAYIKAHQDIDPRFCGFVPRDADGRIKRSKAAIMAFRRQWPCPATGKKTGACPGWALNHSVPLDCGGCDVSQNLEWMRNDVKRVHDTYERKVYGGHGMSPGCP